MTDHVMTASEREVWDLAPVAVVGLEGPQHLVRVANAAFRRLVGRHDVEGVELGDILPVGANPRIFAMLGAVASSGRAQSVGERPLRLSAGSPGPAADVVVDVAAVPRWGPDDDVTGLVVTFVDVGGQVGRRHLAEEHASRAEDRYDAVRHSLVEVQEALLPTALPVLPGFVLGAFYLVASRHEAAGGDWFDAVPMQDGRLGLVVGDVVGQGVAAAAAMGQLRAVVNHLLATAGELTAVLGAAEAFAGRHRDLRAATVAVAVLDPRSGSVDYSTCGHPAPMVLGRSGARFLAPTGGAPLGVGSPVVAGVAHLEPGEVLVLFTDGLVERAGRPVAQTLTRLAEVAGTVDLTGSPEGAPSQGRQAEPSSPARLARVLVDAMTRDGHEDDVTVLVAQVRPDAVGVLEVETEAGLPALAEIRSALRAWLAGVGARPRDADALDTAVTELVANAVEHAYPEGEPGPVRLRAVLGDDGVVTVTIADHGRWLALGQRPQDTRGRGLWVAGALSDQLHVGQHGGVAEESPGPHAAGPDAPGPEGPGGTEARLTYLLRHDAVLGEDGSNPVGSWPPPTGTPYAAVLQEGLPRVLRVSGPVDASTAARFRDRLDSGSRGGVHPLVVDLSAVEVLASAGVQALFAARDRHLVRGQSLTILAPAGSVAAQVLTVSALPFVTV